VLICVKRLACKLRKSGSVNALNVQLVLEMNLSKQSTALLLTPTHNNKEKR